MTQLHGIQFPAGQDGHRSTSRAGMDFFATAAAGAGPDVAKAIQAERNWRKHYPDHIHALTRLGMESPDAMLSIAQNGLARIWQDFEFHRDGAVTGLDAAFDMDGSVATDRFHALTLEGHGARDIRPWGVPNRGRMLTGDVLRSRIDAWIERGIIEESHGEALFRVMDNPQWFDLSDRTLVLMGAGAEAGPLSWLANWRANIVALDLPRSDVWARIGYRMAEGNGRLIVPMRNQVDIDLHEDDGDWTLHAGADLLAEGPEIARWLLSDPAIDTQKPLDIAALAYLDGEMHVRVSVAMDAIMETVSQGRKDMSRMYMATPTDVFAVPEQVARAVMHRYGDRKILEKAGAYTFRGLSAGAMFKPHIRDLVSCSNGRSYGIVDCLVTEQGPNYVLAKRLQQWRAMLARSQGQQVSINVAPPTATVSVVKNKALKAGYDGAWMFDVKVFEPETTNAIMAALWVHDLRCGTSLAHPSQSLAHPAELLMDNACHGGLWRSGFLPRSALPLAAIVGFVEEKAEALGLPHRDHDI